MKTLIEKPVAELAEQRREEQLEVHLANAKRLMKKARADSTWRAYQSDWRQFELFCDGVQLTALPASAKTLISFLSSQAAERKSPSTIQRRLVAIRLVHTGAGFERPTASMPKRTRVFAIAPCFSLVLPGRFGARSSWRLRSITSLIRTKA